MVLFMKNILFFSMLSSLFIAPHVMAMKGPDVVCEEREPAAKHFPRFEALEKALQDTSFDAYAHALHLTKIRMQYAMIIKQLLLSKDISYADKMRFVSIVDPRFQEYSRLNDKEKERYRKERKEFLRIYPEADSVEVKLALPTIDYAIAQWRYLHQSLVHLKGSASEGEGVQYLLKEALFASTCADVDIENVQGHSYYIDECFFTRSLVDSLAFYLFTKRQIDERQLGLTHFCVCLPSTEKEEFNGLGEWMGKSILDPELVSRIKENNETSFYEYSLSLINHLKLDDYFNTEFKHITKGQVVKPTHLLGMHAFAIKVRNIYTASLQKTSNFVRIKKAFENAELHSNPLLQKLCLVPEFPGYIPNLSKFEKHIEPKDKAGVKKDEDAKNKSFLEGTKQPVTKNRNKGETKKKGTGALPKVASITYVAPVTSVPAKAPAVTKATPSRKEIRDAQLQQEKQALIQQKMEAYDRNVESAQAALADIRFNFEEAWEPSVQELELYKLIWSSKRETDTLSWLNLSSHLKSYGWAEDARGGSSVLLLPPSWLEHVATEGTGALKLNRAGMLLDHPHQRAVKPMPDYVFYFLRQNLEHNVGLSEVMIEALIQHVKSKGSAQNSNNE